MKKIIIDGFHKGHVVMLPNPSPTIKLYRPKQVSICTCNEDTIKDVTESNDITYHLAFKSIDGESALYSTDGKSNHFFDNFAAKFKEYPWKKDDVLYFNYDEIK